MRIIDFQNINTSYGNENVLHNISLRIHHGQHYAILGANGSGKSTLIKLFSQDVYPLFSIASGKREIFGKPHWNIWELKSYLGIISHDLHFTFAKQKQSGYQIAASGFYSSIGTFAHQNYTPQQRQQVEDVMQKLRIEHLQKKPATQMSTGEIKKCIVARALVNNPKALLLDEPMTGLDIKARFDFIKVLRQLSAQVTIILITHHVEEIFPEIQNVALLKDGRIFKDDKKENVLTDENLSCIFDIPLQINCENEFYNLRLLF